MIVLRKINSHSVVICKLIKKINNVKDDPRRKLIQTLFFPQLPSAYEFLTRRSIM